MYPSFAMVTQRIEPPVSDSFDPNDDASWHAAQLAARAREQRTIAVHLALSFLFHGALIAFLVLFATTPPGKSEGLTEISLAADVPRLGDENAPEDEGIPGDSTTPPRADPDAPAPDELSIEERTREIERSLAESGAAQDQRFEEEKAQAAAAATAAEARRVRGIRDAKARVDGNLGGRAGIGDLEPRTFYGMKVHSRRMVFVLDISGSMNIPFAKVNLKNAYRTLGPQERFAIVCYDNRVFHWPASKSLAAATPTSKAEADAWVDSLTGGGATAIYDALKRAFELAAGGDAADTIYFLSDGYPTHGISDSSLIAEAARSWNPRRQVIVHAIGIGDHDESLMATLAEEHRGSYRALR